jgi:hypothetical protein
MSGKFESGVSHVMNCLHEVLSCQRQDIRELVSAYVKERIVHPDIAENWLREYDRLYGDDVVKSLVRGSTYTSFREMSRPVVWSLLSQVQGKSMQMERRFTSTESNQYDVLGAKLSTTSRLKTGMGMVADQRL